METDGYERLRKVRGFALGLAGSFIFAFSSVVITVRQQPFDLVLGALSVAALSLAYFSLTAESNLSRLVFLVSTGCVLAAEASAVMLYLYTANAFIYTFATLAGSLLALKGVTEMGGMKVDDYYWRRRKEAVPKELTA